MGPRGAGNVSSFWEFWSLAFWWAAWSLADAYLLPFSPLSEITVLWLCIVVAGISRCIRSVDGQRRYAEASEEGDAEYERPARKDASSAV